MSNPTFSLDSLFHSFENQRVMVVGDLMLDRYIYGHTSRISPEAPVPILDFQHEDNRLGGAANVALNLQALGAFPILCGVVGSDVEGQLLFESMERERILTSGVISSAARISTVKTRMIAGKQQLMRLDREHSHDLSEQETNRFLEKTIGLIDSEEITGLIFQDYNKGVLTKAVIETITLEAQKRKIPISVDPKHRNFWNYRGVDLFKPNLKEVKDALPNDVSASMNSLKSVASTIRERNHCKITLITLSEKGVFLDDGKLSQIFSTKKRTVADVCGAGDTVISIAALALSAGLSSPDIAMLANMAGGQVVEKTGVVPVEKEQLRQELLQLFLEV